MEMKRQRPTKAERHSGRYIAADGNETWAKSLRFPTETISLIKACNKYYKIGSFTDTVFQVIEAGLRSLQDNDEKFDRMIQDVIFSQPAAVPRRSVYGTKVETTEDKNDRDNYLKYMRDNYQFLDREDFIKDGIPADIVDKFFETL